MDHLNSIYSSNEFNSDGIDAFDNIMYPEPALQYANGIRSLCENKKKKRLRIKAFWQALKLSAQRSYD